MESRKTDARQEEVFRLPSWEQLPDIDLYMDQVLLLVDRSLHGFPGYEERGLTASMVNNYVKQGVLPAPIKKRYGRQHLACLLMICALKPALPISAIRAVTERQMEAHAPEQVYGDFCRVFEKTAEEAAMQTAPADAEGDAADRIWGAALRAAAEQARAVLLYRAAFENDCEDTVMAANGEKK